MVSEDHFLKVAYIPASFSIVFGNCATLRREKSTSRGKVVVSQLHGFFSIAIVHYYNRSMTSGIAISTWESMDEAYDGSLLTSRDWHRAETVVLCNHSSRLSANPRLHFKMFLPSLQHIFSMSTLLFFWMIPDFNMDISLGLQDFVQRLKAAGGQRAVRKKLLGSTALMLT